MNDERPLTFADGLLMLLVLAVAVGARYWYLEFGPAAGNQPTPLHVQADGDAWADVRAFVHGRPPAHAAPLYAWLVSRLVPFTNDQRSIQEIARWVQCGLGTLTAGLYFLFARRAFGSRLVAALAGLFCALDPFWIINTAEIQDGVLATFLLAVCVVCGAAAARSGCAWASWFLGLGLAGLAMTRAALLPFALVTLLWFLLRARTLPRGGWYGLLAFLGFVAGLAPWTAGNFREFHDTYPVADSTYYHLWVGNNPAATGGPASASTLRKAPTTQRRLAEEVVQEVRDNPAGTWQRRLWAGLCFFFGEDWLKERRLWRADPSAAAWQATPDWLRQSYPAVLSGFLLGLLVLAALGWRWTYGSRREAMPAALAFLWVPVPYLLSHAEALQGPRLPLDGVLLCYGAFALACMVPAVARGLVRRGDAGRAANV